MRRSAWEFLDREVTPELRRRSHRDIALSNALFGGASAIWQALLPLLDSGVRQISLLDVGTGIADIPARLLRRAGRRGVDMVCYALDSHGELVARPLSPCLLGIGGDARALPVRDASVDVVYCSQLLHHFSEDGALAVLREMNRVARRLVIVSDLSRNWLAALGIWAISFPLGFHAVSRHDGYVSVLRGFTVAELAALVAQATGQNPLVRRCYAWRIVAAWSPGELV